MKMLLSVFAISMMCLGGCTDTKSKPESAGVLCATSEGAALWTGKCVGGLAQGSGTATYKDSYIDTIDGQFVDGVPGGIVKIEFYDGGFYKGTRRDGNPHGYGIDMEPWGEGYEGNWVDGFRDGEGTYIRSDGKRIPGLWQHGRLVGSWFTDLTTGCEFWWGATSDPIGEASWSGECVEGKANGQGTVLWSVSRESTLFPSKVEFNGTLVDGVIQGEGVWVQIVHASNVVTTSNFRGIWKDGQRDGMGFEITNREYNEGDLIERIVVVYEGGWNENQYGGQGRREETKHFSDGGVDKWIEEGAFANRMLNGEGSSLTETKLPNGDTRLEVSEGRFEDRQFRGYGEEYSEQVIDGERQSSRTKYTGLIYDGGTGYVEYRDGDRFEGLLNAGSYPTEGHCELPTIDYSGPCNARTTATSEWSWMICLVKPNDPENCLKIIGSLIS